ncbi:Phosphate-selective porin O and P [Aquisphaera giovannonii]|uniref:Phosphate-selective porin O and P n=1 Tax=Aquisphaera giovannonii TaxID=406548 RepID=A0A5B9W713_9BACT|nr:porin [Aquisphaera giovannonii]QEH36456.1 Phosphate-selective porin O and P [Aquisphaera giovannonii]
MTPREAQLEQRVRQLESMVKQLSAQMQSRQGVGAGGAAPDPPNAATAVAPSATGGVSGPGQSLPPNPPPSSRFDSPPVLANKKASVKFGPGFEIRSDDDEFIFQFHNLTQFEYRGYEQSNEQGAVRDSFLIPRQWFMFSGRMSKPIGYFVSLANGFDNVTALDVFMDFDFDPRLRIRAGRYKAPFTYEFLVEPVQGLIQPERSIFFNNFGQNRDLGVMAFGRLFRDTFDYAGGIFNGNRNGYIAPADSKFGSAFVNWKPFANAEGSLLQNFNVGGSVFGGNSLQQPAPATFRTVVPLVGNAVAGVPFLALNGNVRESGPKTFWDMHAAYFYKQLAVIGEWGSGFQDYALANTPARRTRLGVQSFYAQAGYLLTGETRSSVGIVRPRHPFSLKPGTFGLGAWELVGRYQHMDMSSNVFSAGLADPNLWANRVEIVDLGFNWHINQYLKFYFEWEHAMFNQPVEFSPGRYQINSDLFLARMQLYF